MDVARLLSSFLVCKAGLALASTAIAQSLDAQARRFAECEFIYAYTAQIFQLRNNNGAAVATARRSSIVTTANMMLSVEGDSVPAWKVKAFTEMRPAIKRQLDSGKVDAIVAAGQCDIDALSAAARIRLQNQKLWGKTFDELQQNLFEHLRLSLGLQ